jgi:hypothetical protein
MHAHKLLNKIAIVITFVIWVMEALDYSQCTSKKEVANYAKARQHVVKHRDDALTFSLFVFANAKVISPSDIS